MTDDNIKFDFTKVLRNKLEKRVLAHFEAIADAFEGESTASLQSQMDLLGQSFEKILKVYHDNGYINSRGIKVPLGPRDLLFLQQATENAMRLRSDLLMLPLGMKDSTEFLRTVDNLSKDNVDPSNAGLKEPPPLVRIDSEKQNEKEVPPQSADAHENDIVDNPEPVKVKQVYKALPMKPVDKN